MQEGSIGGLLNLAKVLHDSLHLFFSPLSEPSILHAMSYFPTTDRLQDGTDI